ncbi:MAG: TolC family protein, partial [Fidelibacterota bacterium]
IAVVFRMRKGWETYLKLTRSLGILEQYRGELETFRTIALTQYATGTGVTQHPILKLQIEISLVESQINGFESQLESVVNDLQSLFDGAFSPGLFAGNRTALIPVGPSPEGWMESARRVHPGYGKAVRELDIARLQNELAVRKNYPDLVTGLTYTVVGPTDLPGSVESGADAFGFKAGLNLPIWFGRNRARIQSTELTIRSREEQVEEIWNQIENDLRSTWRDLGETEQTYLLYSDKLLQESEQMLSSAFSTYETGKISFLDLLDSERMVVRVRLDFERVESERRIAGARLLQAAGMIHFDEE